MSCYSEQLAYSRRKDLIFRIGQIVTSGWHVNFCHSKQGQRRTKRQKNAETSEMSTLSIIIQFLMGTKLKLNARGIIYQVCGPNERSLELTNQHNSITTVRLVPSQCRALECHLRFLFIVFICFILKKKKSIDVVE